MGMLKKQEQIRKLPFNSLGPQIELKIPRLLIFHQAEIKEISPAIHKLFAMPFRCSTLKKK